MPTHTEAERKKRLAREAQQLNRTQSPTLSGIAKSIVDSTSGDQFPRQEQGAGFDPDDFSGPRGAEAPTGLGLSPRFTQPDVVKPPTEKSKIDVSGSQSIAGPVGIAPVTDRFQGQFDESVKALERFDAESRSRSGAAREDNSLRGGSIAQQRRFSGQRSNLVANRRNFKDLLSKGSFADNANIQKEQRQQQAASAQSLLAGAANTALETSLLPEALAQLDQTSAAARKKQKGFNASQQEQFRQRALQ